MSHVEYACYIEVGDIVRTESGLGCAVTNVEDNGDLIRLTLIDDCDETFTRDVHPFESVTMGDSQDDEEDFDFTFYDIPAGTPDSWIPDNPNEDGFTMSDFI